MFTGIVEEIGEIQDVRKGIKSSRLAIKAKKVIDDTRIGDSICTNGVCLTVASIAGNVFEADIMAQTLRNSSLGNLEIGSKVNLERALTLEKRLGGHLVSGHIDGVGKIISNLKEDNAIWITIEANSEILRYIVKKGSIAIDGISLTVAYVDDKSFKVSIIPHTFEKTTLLYKKSDAKVNLECDVIGKYVEKLLGIVSNEEEGSKNNIDANFLRENGFI